MKHENTLALRAFRPAVVGGRRPPASPTRSTTCAKLRDSTINLINALVEQGVLTRAKADAIIAQAQQAGSKPSAAANGPTGGATAPSAGLAPGRGPRPALRPSHPARCACLTSRSRSSKRSPTRSSRMWLAQAKAERWGEPGAYPDWLHRFSWDGDLRLRDEAECSHRAPNAPVALLQAYGVNIGNSTQTDDRLRFRARFGFDATVSDSVTVGMRLASGGVGAGSNPGSENQTLGTYQTRATVGFDRAFIAYHPLTWLEASGGIVGNPYFEPTSLVWADDVSLGGVVVRVFRANHSESEIFHDRRCVSHPASRPGSDQRRGQQMALCLSKRRRVAAQSGHGLQVGAALYDYRNIEGTPNPLYSTAYTDSAAPFRQTGNTVFDINGAAQHTKRNAELSVGPCLEVPHGQSSVDFDTRFVGPTHIILTGDWVENLGFDEREIEQRTGYRVSPQIRGWQTRFTVGYPGMQPKYAWQAYVGYRYVQRDATVRCVHGSGFPLGRHGRQLLHLGGRYLFERNTFVNLRGLAPGKLTARAGRRHLGRAAARHQCTATRCHVVVLEERNAMRKSIGVLVTAVLLVAVIPHAARAAEEELSGAVARDASTELKKRCVKPSRITRI